MAVSARKVLNTERADCAFCNGMGQNPKTKYSNCPVCGGRGIVKVSPPVIACVFCHGQGAPPWGPLTCPVCRGKGVVSVKVPFEACPRCRGTGQNPAGRLYCVTCKGTGVVSKG